MYQIEVKVELVRIVKGETEHKETLNYRIKSMEVLDRLDVFLTLLREFGRCSGGIPMGYKFFKNIKYDDGTTGTEYATCTIVKGAKPAAGFVLGE